MNAKLARGWHSWVEAADELGEARRTMMWALKSLLPTARSMRMAVNKWADVMIQRWSLLRAVAALTSDGKRRGFVTWAEHASTARSEREAATLTLHRVVASVAAARRACCDEHLEQHLERAR